MIRRFENKDCIEGMKEFPDKYFDLAICDPPYGIKWSAAPVSFSGKTKHSKTGEISMIKGNVFDPKDWDSNQPEQNYFDELFRISKIQIIFGENYIQFDQKKLSSGRIFWDKVNDKSIFSDGELAWTNAHKSIKQIEFLWNGMLQGKSFIEGRIQQGNKKLVEKKIHPTQKPIELYKWILQNYAKTGDLIFDSHVGSGSSLIACEELGFEYVGFEIDPDYFAAATKRIDEFRKQPKFGFMEEENKKIIQESMF